MLLFSQSVRWCKHHVFPIRQTIHSPGPLVQVQAHVNQVPPLTVMTFTKEVFPAFWRPMSDSSISCWKNRLRRGTDRGGSKEGARRISWKSCTFLRAAE